MEYPCPGEGIEPLRSFANLVVARFGCRSPGIYNQIWALPQRPGRIVNLLVNISLESVALHEWISWRTFEKVFTSDKCFDYRKLSEVIRSDHEETVKSGVIENKNQYYEYSTFEGTVPVRVVRTVDKPSSSTVVQYQY